MREIKFRAWDTKKRLFIEDFDFYQDYAISANGKALRVENFSGDGTILVADEAIKLMQYTGLVLDTCLAFL